MLAQSLRSVADFALARQKYQNVAAQATHCQFVQRGTHRLWNILHLAFGILLQRTVTHLYWITAATDLHDRRTAEMFSEALRIQRCRSNDELEITAARQQLLKITQQEIDIQAALMRLVDDDGVVFFQQPIALDFCQQNAIGHQLDAGIRRYLVIKANLIAHQATQLSFQFNRNARCHRPRRDTAWLGVGNDALHTPAQTQTDFR